MSESDTSKPTGTDAEFVEVDFDPFEGAAIASVIPTTEAQREVWLADQLDPKASLAFNESVTLALRGSVDPQAMTKAIDALVSRHDILRSALSSDGTELLIQETNSIVLEVDDLTDVSPVEADALLAAFLAAETSTPFDLINGPLFRARLISLAPNEHALVLGAHHLVCDGFSFGILLNELAPLYRAAVNKSEHALPPADSFADYAAKLASDQQTLADAATDLQYWQGEYADDLPAVLDLPTSKPRPSSRTFASARLDLSIRPEAVAQVRKFAGQTRTGAFAVLLTGFASLLARLSGQTDLVIGVPSAGQSVVGSDSLVGHCVNLLPIRLPIDLNQSSQENVRVVQEKIFEAFEHQRCTFGTLLKKLPIERDPARPTLVSVMFNLDQALDGDDLDFANVRSEILSNPRQAENFEMFLNISQTRERMALECQYNTDLFDEATVRLWLTGLRTLLKQMTDDPEQPLAILDIVGQQQAQAIGRLNATDTDLPPFENLGNWLSDSARIHAERRAIVRRNTETGKLSSMSYQELESKSNQLARALRQRAIGRGKNIGICLPRDERLIIAQWAALKSGAAYVPLDPSYPDQRLAMMAQDAGIELVITELETVVQLDLGIGEVMLLDDTADEISGLPETPLPASSLDPLAEDPAYLIYTSGSTGRPKGVRVPHRAVINFLGSMARKPGLEKNDRLLAVTTLSFDIAVLELMLPLIRGAQIVLADSETTRDGSATLALINQTDANVLQATPSTWRLLLDAGLPANRQLKALVGGEALPPDLAARLLQHCRSVWNLYGPTETTIWSTIWRVRQPDAGIRIGRPIANTQIHVLDERAQPCPIGVPGEIVIGGAGVALGYHNQPLLTTERFMPDTFSGMPGGRLYRTGDLGRWTWTGDLEHLGRMDHQVKVRGFRIELGEIEATLQRHELIKQAIVVTHEVASDDVRLLAYLVSPYEVSSDTLTAQLREYLRQSLPEYMVPQHFVPIDEMPLLNNGKVDRNALPTPDELSGQNNANPTNAVAPGNDLEQQVQQVMAKVLNKPDLGMTDDFFAVGGHSILAARVITTLNKTLNVQLPMRTIFEAPTPAQLTTHITPMTGANASEATPVADPLPVIHHPNQSTGPLTPMQKRVHFVEQMSPGRVVYNVPSAHRLLGPFDRAHFERALASIISRQPSLRTVIKSNDDGPTQQVLDSVEVSMPMIDLSEIPADKSEAALRRKLDALIAEPFDLSTGPLFKTVLLHLSASEHVFFFMAHHIVWDGWSFDVLYDEFARAYSAEEPEAIEAQAITYIDFAHWQKKWLSSRECRDEIEFWANRLSKIKRPLPLPCDMPRSGQRSGEGATVWIEMSSGMTERLREVASRTGSTLNMVMLSAYSLMMSDLAMDKKITIGLPMRGRERAEFEPVMGFFNNLLPLHLQPHLDLAFTDWLNLVRREVIDVFAHQRVPFERLATELGDASQLDYQVLFSFQDARDRVNEWGALQHSNIPVFQRGATEDLGLWLLDGNDGLKGGITYNTDLYHRETARTLRRRFSNLLKAIVKYPDMSIGKLLPRMHRQTSSHGGNTVAASLSMGSTVVESEHANRDARPTPSEMASGAMAAHSVADKPDSASAPLAKDDTHPPVDSPSASVTKAEVQAEPPTQAKSVRRSKPATEAQADAGPEISPEPVSPDPVSSISDASDNADAVAENQGIDFTPQESFEDSLIETTKNQDLPSANVSNLDAADSELMPGGTIPMPDSVIQEDGAHLYQGLDDVSDAKILHESNPDIVPDSDPSSLAPGQEPSSDRTASEEKLADIWARVLRLDSGAAIELDDNFFDMGGTSLQAMQVMDEIEHILAVRGNPRLMVFGSLKQLAVSYLGEPGDEPVIPDEEADQNVIADDSVPARKGLFGRLFGKR